MLDWQNITALTVVAGAAIYLASVIWRSLAKRKAAGCGSCASCPAESKEPAQLVTLEPLGQSRRAK